jgi:hypothetical protein
VYVFGQPDIHGNRRFCWHSSLPPLRFSPRGKCVSVSILFSQPIQEPSS